MLCVGELFLFDLRIRNVRQRAASLLVHLYGAHLGQPLISSGPNLLTSKLNLPLKGISEQSIGKRPLNRNAIVSRLRVI